jgi:hypothetical protein
VGDYYLQQIKGAYSFKEYQEHMQACTRSQEVLSCETKDAHAYDLLKVLQ